MRTVRDCPKPRSQSELWFGSRFIHLCYFDSRTYDDGSVGRGDPLSPQKPLKSRVLYVHRL